jgi:[acyl-carrier-protein] S-malonyltransferase
MKIAFVFPGQGSQEVGMGQELAQAYPEARAALDEADAALGGGLTKIIAEGPVEELRKTANTQPAILAVSIAAYRALMSQGGSRLQPAFFAGHSLGEYSALVAAGALSLSDAVRAVRARGTFMQEAVPPGEGAMAAVLGLDPDVVTACCREAAAAEPGKVVEPANFNSPEQTVIAGHAAAVDRAIAVCKSKGAKRALPLPVSAPFHCQLMSPVKPRLREVLAPMAFSKPSAPVIANASAKPNEDPAKILDLLIEQVTAPVRWVETVKSMAALGVDTLIEIGPGNVLTGLARRIDKGLKALSVEDPAGVAAALKEVGA